MGVTVTGAAELSAEFKAAAVALPAALGEVLEGYGDTLAESVRSHASGRPGPNEVSGDYKGSIGVDPQVSGTEVRVEVGTDEPQGWRLEMGYKGTDSLGRQYDQPPFAHWEPALAETEGDLDAALAVIGLLE